VEASRGDKAGIGLPADRIRKVVEAAAQEVSRPKTASIDFRADDWIRTSMDLFTRQLPFSVELHRQVSRNAVILTLSIGFGGQVRSQANIPVWQKPSELSFCGY
jgi:hypothetical protein